MRHFDDAGRPFPFLKRPGGKRRLLPKFEEMGLYPEGWLDDDTRAVFVPFMGGGSATLRYAKTPSGKPRPIFAQDADWDLVNCFSQLRDDPEGFLREVERLYEGDVREGERFYYGVRSADRDEMWPFPSLYRAARYFYINKTGYNGLWRVNLKGQCNVPWGKRPFEYDASRLKAVSAYLIEMPVSIVHSHDWHALVGSARAGDLILMDPPYVPAERQASSFVSYTKEGFDTEDTADLLGLMQTMRDRGVDVMMTNHGPPWLLESAKRRGLFITRYAAGRSISRSAEGRQKVPEIAITNYRPGQGADLEVAPLTR